MLPCAVHTSVLSVINETNTTSHINIVCSGEGHRQEIIEFVGCALDVYHDMIRPDPLPISPGVTSQSPYPTKVTAEDDTLIISDAGLHKIFILSLDELKVQVS